LQINLDPKCEKFKAVAYPPPELLTVIYGAAGPETVSLTSDELADLRWPVRVSDDWTAHIMIPVAGGVAS
jgi:hypothetical protein